MGYFFRPRFPFDDCEYVVEIMKPLAKKAEEDKNLKNNRYSMDVWDNDKMKPMWRDFGIFIHYEQFKPIIEQLFTIRHDPQYQKICGHQRGGLKIGNDDYSGDAIWVRKDVPRSNFFVCKIFNQLWEIIKKEYPEWIDDEYRTNLIHKLKFIVFADYEDWEAH